jgi:hypothetical protein
MTISAEVSSRSVQLKRRGLLQVFEGKSKAAKRILPLVPEVYAVLERRREEQGRPKEGWVFPSKSAEGHLNGDTTKEQHAIAVERPRSHASSLHPSAHCSDAVCRVRMGGVRAGENRRAQFDHDNVAMRTSSKRCRRESLRPLGMLY